MAENIENMISEIENIIRVMENGNISLDDSINSYEKGMKLINDCSAKLNSAEKNIKIIEKKLNGNFEESTFLEHDKEDGSETVDSFKTTIEKRSKPRKTKAVVEEEKDDDDFQNDLELF